MVSIANSTWLGMTGRPLGWAGRIGGLLRAQEGSERVLSSLRDPSQLDQEPSKTAVVYQFK